jgi:hypothetical protein
VSDINIKGAKETAIDGNTRPQKTRVYASFDEEVAAEIHDPFLFCGGP